MSSFLFTTSWDDGHPLDMRLADMLGKYRFKATFYMPAKNSEGREVVSLEELGSISENFEIGGHTYNHIYLDSISGMQAEQEIRDGKLYIEEQIQKPVSGFCYPGGRHNKKIREMVRSAGFEYGRTVENLRVDSSFDPYLMPTTIQFKNHSKNVYLKNYIGKGGYIKRFTPFCAALLENDLHKRLMALLRLAMNGDGVFHLWGHSWEIEQTGTWNALESFLAEADKIVPMKSRVENHALYHRSPE